MKVMLTLAPDDLDAMRIRVRRFDELGFDALGFGDSPGYHDPYVCIASAATVSSRLRLGPMVTNVVTRAPQVTARALQSLDALSGGRVFAGLGAGDSALAGARRDMASVEVMRAGLEEIRSTWKSVDSAAGGWRLVVAANGPRTLEMAGAVADVVVSGAGIDPDSISRSMAVVREGARHNPGGVEFWAVVRMVVGDDRGKALGELRPLLASGANHVFHSRAERDMLSPDIRAKVVQLRERYDYSRHGRQASNPNADLVDELGLREFLGRRFALAGPPAGIIEGIRSLAAQGVAGLVIPAVGVDVDVLIERFGRDILPHI